MLSSKVPHVFTIPSGRSFLETLARGLRRETDPLRLSQMEIFLPTRRACIELKRALMRQGEGKCLLLPKFSPLGDLDEDEEWLSSPQDELDLKPIIPSVKRLGLLTNLIEDYAKKTGLPSSPALSLKLAKSLVKLMDQAAIENVPWEGLVHLVPSEFAGHWQLTLSFLEIITSHWPQILEETGTVEPYVRHQQLVELLIARWEKNPPDHPIIGAGSTGTMPATSRLLQAIAHLPQGQVILPGLDMTLGEEEIEDLSPCHPQYAPTRFLKKMGLKSQDVLIWPGAEEVEGHPRAHLLAEALKPSFSLQGQFPDKALENVSFIPCASPHEEALAISILLRQQLETPHKRIALVTSDLRLVERVRAELRRWGIEIDSSSGEALDRTPPGVFLKLCAEYIANPHDQVALLSFLKHPLCRMGKSVNEVRSLIRQFERKVLRGGGKNSHGNISVVGGIQENLVQLVHSLCYLDPRLRGDDKNKYTFKEMLQAHRRMAETFSIDDQGICYLWKEAAGEAARGFFETLEESSQDFSSLSWAEYPAFFEELFQGQSLRVRAQKHPRLSILGPIEARLFSADVMILGALNEGTWPPEIEMDPWLNRSMRHEMGFPSPERRIGLSGHDFSQAFSSPQVYLTRALKVNGTPTLACRWLERLEVYLKAWGRSLPQEGRVLEWSRHLDSPEKHDPSSAPLPRPPVQARPRRLSVTQIETWMRDPYALYARSILTLSPLDPLNAVVGPAERGTLIHAALDQFFKVCPDPHHKHALDRLLFVGKTLFESCEDDSSVRFWKPRFYSLAKWFVETERRTRLPGTQTFTEAKGKVMIYTPQGPFECTAKADRIDVLPDGRMRIIDYKTGALPTDQDVILGFSPQLPLEGAIALHQGFEGIFSTALESLQFWGLKGDMSGGIIKTIPGDPHELSLKSLAGLERMILLFESETTPYPARPLLAKSLKYNDYAHLARVSS